MKGVFSCIAVLLGLIFLLNSCDIPETEFGFTNNMATETVTITPDSGEDWDGFSLSPAGGSMTVKSENSNIFFTAMDGSTVIYPSQNYTYDSSNREYTFYDNP